jgi:hypothetical protein
MKPDSCQSRWINPICRVYAVLLYAYPEAFRSQFGGEMQQVFRGCCRAAARENHLPLFVLLTLWDWVRTSTRERLAAVRNPFTRNSRLIQACIMSPEIHVAQTLAKNGWLLALCGLLDAIYAAMNFFMQGPDGSVMLRTSVNSNGTLENMGLLALAAGTSTIATGSLGSRDKSWLVVVNGVASGALGLTLCGAFGFRIGFRTLALLTVVMALSLGVYELSVALTLRNHSSIKLLLCAAGVVSVGFALVFFAFAFDWVELGPRPMSDFLWFGFYFGFTALSMLGLALGMHGSRPFQPNGYRSETPLLDVG